MNLVILGNIVMLAGSSLMVTVGFLKKKRQILAVQCVQCVIQSAAHLMLGAASGAIAGVLAVARNLICLKREFTLRFKLVFIAIQAVLTWAFNSMGVIGWMPFFATAIFIWMLDTKDERKLKISIIIGQIMWTLFDWRALNFVGVAFDVFSIFSNAVGIYMLRSKRADAE